MRSRAGPIETESDSARIIFNPAQAAGQVGVHTMITWTMGNTGLPMVNCPAASWKGTTLQQLFQKAGGGPCRTLWLLAPSCTWPTCALWRQPLHKAHPENKREWTQVWIKNNHALWRQPLQYTKHIQKIENGQKNGLKTTKQMTRRANAQINLSIKNQKNSLVSLSCELEKGSRSE